MANDLLTDAIRNAGLDRDQIADLTQVDPKTVGRWIAGRVPHPRHRAVLASELRVAEVDIWPDAIGTRTRTGLDEITGAWARRDEKATPDWRALLRASERQVDLIGYSLMSLVEANGALRALTDKADQDVPIRIATANPDAEHVLAADLAGRQPGRLTGRIIATQDQLQTIAVHAGIQIRRHEVATSHTILRFDDDMLVTIHLHGTAGFQAPLLRLRRQRDYGIFDQLARHVEDVWATAKPIAAPTGSEKRSGSAAPAEKSGADDLLDRLESRWRPGS